MNDLISRQMAIDAVMRNACNTQRIYEAIKGLPSEQPEIIHCRDCKHWIPGFINDNDNFIPPKCGKYQQMVGHSADDYCNYAERREVSE